LANERLVIILSIAVPLCVLGFVLLINHFNKVAYLKRHTTFLKEINEFEVLKSKNKLSEFEDGHSYINRDHPYILDLDIFGSHSLFQLLNRTTTESGQVMLAEWLSECASNETILERQQAVKELSPKIEWRQNFQASGMHFKNTKSDYKKLLDWMEKPEQLLPHQSKYFIVSILLSILSTSAVVYYTIHAFSSTTSIIPLLIILFVNFLVLRKVGPIAEEILDNTQQNIRYSAANEINKLKKILDMFQLRGTKRTDNNKFYLIFNVFWLFDIYLIILSEKWKQKNKFHLKTWASAVSEFEVLSCLAGFHYSNPSFTFPEIKEAPYNIHFEMLGHPLINSDSRVCNHFKLNGRGGIAMITGSNMAGKSTFLRTVGVNMVLALLGAPCCAMSGQVSNMKIFTSMRTQDNLKEGISTFNAELKRLKQLLNLIKSGQPIFFLLDEMFKGTNSEDRHIGGVSLIKQLSELNAFGIVSTHDLELAKLSENRMTVANFCFNSVLQKEKMIFNYELSKGICKDFNASELMKKSGIIILTNTEDIR
jgi:hypothetical protein